MSIQKHVLSFIVSLAVLTLSACGDSGSSASKEADQDKIYQNFQITYFASNNTTEYRATFTKSNGRGSRLSLSDPSSITVNGQRMSTDEGDAVYSFKSLGRPQAQVEFLWVDVNGKTYRNDIDQISVGFVDAAGAISKSTTAKIAWSGNSPSEVGSSDRVSVRLRSLVDSQYVERFADEGAAVVAFDSDSLKSLKLGSAEMRLRRETTRSLADTTEAGGQVTISYEAETRKVQITP